MNSHKQKPGLWLMRVKISLRKNSERYFREVSWKQGIWQNNKTNCIRGHKKWLIIKEKGSDFKSTRCKTKVFKEQARRNSVGNVTCHRDGRKKTKEKMLNVLTDRTRTSQPEPGINSFLHHSKTMTYLIFFLV